MEDRSSDSGHDSASEEGELESSRCFQVPVQLTCKSPRKNDLEPSFKAVLEQGVLLQRNSAKLDLVLLGANLDSQEGPKLAQLRATHRLLKARVRSNTFCALIWGDLNNRLVAYQELREHLQEVRKGELELMDSGVELLVDLLADPQKRRELLLKDALVFKGFDVTGRAFVTPSCDVLMSKIFTLQIEAAGRIQVPLPSYKHTPLERLMSDKLGIRLRVE
ncbi:unnamed protein product, partial [Polarella glacialis]